MRFYLIILLSVMVSSSLSAQNDSIKLDHLAGLALGCLQQEYPNKLNQVLASAEDLRSPQELHPAFYGCFDWHSSVHGHWMLVRLLKNDPNIEQAKEIRAKLNENLTMENIKQEVAYFEEKENRLFERTYGWAWLLKLADELNTWDDPKARKWAVNLAPLTDLIVERYMEFLPKLTYPIRTGEHPNTAFGLTFAWDYAVSAKNTDLQELISARAQYWYGGDEEAPIRWEPGGFDFLSPSLEEARIMSRILDQEAYVLWLNQFLPGMTDPNAALSFAPAFVSDRTDGKIVHLDGLNLSRTWCLREIAKALPGDTSHLTKAANEHFKVSSKEILSGSYAGEHWLASFAVYAYFSLGL